MQMLKKEMDFMPKRIMESLKCLRCGFSWLPRILGTPKACPHCKRYDWNIIKIEPKIEKGDEQK